MGSCLPPRTSPLRSHGSVGRQYGSSKASVKDQVIARSLATWQSLVTRLLFFNQNMDFKQISDKALAVRAKYNQLNQKNVGHAWSNRELMEGFVGDVGDLMKFVMAKEGSRHIDDVDEKLKHELADCLWCILVLSKNYGIDLDTEFMEKMDELDSRVSKDLIAYDQG